MAGAMGSTAKAMGAVNKQMDIQGLQSTLQGFEKESTKMDMAGELSTYVPVCVVVAK